MTRSQSPAETEAVILDRMAASRIALRSANLSLSVVPATQGLAGRSVSTVLTTVKEAPRVTLLIALCMGALVLGPRRTVRTALRSLAVALVGSSARKLVENKTAVDQR
jgi:hypothetical protein